MVKRAAAAAIIPEEEEEEEIEEVEKEQGAKMSTTPQRTVSRDDGTEHQEYKPGSIRRVRLKNFLTYNNVEFNPGPR